MAISLFGGQVHFIVCIWLLSGVVGIVIFALLTVKYYDDLTFSRRHHLSRIRCSISEQALETCVARLVIILIVCATGIYTLVTEMQLPVLPSDAATDPIAPWVAIIPWLLVIQGLREFRYEAWLLHQIDS